MGNMNNARGAAAIREAKKLKEKDAQVAMVAIQVNARKVDFIVSCIFIPVLHLHSFASILVNLIPDAEKLYANCGRYDLLIKLYQACGRWKDALRVCSKHDRIHLKATHYLYAKHLESTGNIEDAIKHYEKAETHRYEVPRMLFSKQRMPDLEV